jgi:adenosylcobinamide-phosphate synthase
LLTFFSLFILLKSISEFEIIFLIVSTIFVFFGLANRSLIHESLKVIWVLRQEGIDAGRKQLSRIVGRETTKLDANQIRTAVLETLAENLSDGVIAPLFFYAIGGVPAMLAYKMANTLDSMIGYKSDRFLHFGWFAAKFDDVLNFIPSRITAFLMAAITLNWRAFKFIFKYGGKHSSPNAGYPEAALAGILNCRFGGPNIYHGVLVKKPFIGENSRVIADKDVLKACVLNGVIAIVFVSIVLVIYLN